MKKIIYALGLMIMLLTGSVFAAEQKIAIVNVMYILQHMPEREAVSKTLNSEFESRAKTLQAQEKKAQEAAQRLQKENLTLSASDKKKLTEIIGAFEEKAKAFSQDYHKRETEEVNKLLGRVQEAVSKLVKQENYSLVLKAEAAFYVNDTIDITEEVLAQVKK
ncbi:MAG: OmpH family outer membrane protein [Candidatus Schmidhempelia sp.]|nr:OmpH family outer membrane protein [Candidatus Schmidhempelia sp.]